MHLHLPRIIAALSLLTLAACGDGPATPEDGGIPPDGAVVDGGTAPEPQICVGVRGNGPAITAHFAALGRFTEHYGLPAGGAGGSSGSISLFFLESVSMNPLIETCGDRPCTTAERNDRAGLLFKSLLGYLDVLFMGDEALAFGVLSDIIGRVAMEGITSLFTTDPTAALDALRTLLESPDLRDLVNQEVLDLLTGDHPIAHGRDIAGALTAAASFDASDPTIFVRPGVLDFAAFARKLGRIGSFLAAYEPVDRVAMDAWLSECATAGHGLTWFEIAGLPATSGTCASAFADLASDYRTTLLADEASYASRADDEVGANARVLVTTSVLEGDAITAWQAARAAYLATDPVTLTVNFDDVRIGYWGSPEDLAAVLANPRGFTDVKTMKATSLGQATWAEVLSYSPAEPGLARALELPDGRISAGGWSDLQPTLVLQNMGCDEVVYLTRRGGNSGFATGVATLLGMSEAQRLELFEFGNPDSAASLSLSEADGVWCTDWDAFEAAQVAELTNDAHGAPFQTSVPYFTDAADPYANIVSSADQPGCTFGIAPAP